MSYVIKFEGLAELARALKETEPALLEELQKELRKVGELIRVESVKRFSKNGRVGRVKTVDNFEVRVRAGGQAHAVLVVGQKLRKTTGKRSDYGALQMTEALLPSRDAKMVEAERLLQTGVVQLLKEHGFV